MPALAIRVVSVFVSAPKMRRLRYGTRCGDHVFLINQGRHELEAVEPDNGLLVVGVGSERMEGVVGAHRDVGIVAMKPPPNW